MKREEAKARIEKLKKEINYHRYLYHVLDKPDISDAAFDSLKNELAELEQQFPEFITSDSPTQRVGGKALEKFEKIRHKVPMLSFNDAFSREDMQGWEERIFKLVPEKTHPGYFCELKIDGLAISLEYENKLLKTGSTRGDGKIGEDVTQNLRTVAVIPLRLLGKGQVLKNLKDMGYGYLSRELNEKYDGNIEVRGEVFITKKEFERLNLEKRKKKEAPFANPRNFAAGSIRQLDPKVTASRRLSSFAYALITNLGQKTHEEEHIILKAMGFKTNLNNKFCNNLNDVFGFHKYWAEKRERLPYEIDGIVVIVNNNESFKRMGVAGKAPRGAIAYKFSGKETTTRVLDIKIQVGRTGVLTPVAYLEPVLVGGVTISRATLHNEDEIKRLGIKIGDTAVVRRAGDVIPEVVRVFPGLRKGTEKEFRMPRQCPICGAPTKRKPGEVAVRCSNKKCFAMEKRKINHFVSKNAFDVSGLGDKIVSQLINEGLVTDAADIFKLTEGDLKPLDRFAEKSSENLVRSIKMSKKIDLPRFIYALGIRHVGEETSIDLARNFGSLGKLKKASIEELSSVRDIGDVVAESIYKWFRNKDNLCFVKKLEKAGVIIKGKRHPSTLRDASGQASSLRQGSGQAGQEKLKGKTFVFTGELARFTRDRAKDTVRALEGDVSESVSSSTDYVVAGKEAGSKYEKAKKLGVKILSEGEFLRMIKQVKSQKHAPYRRV